MYGLAERQQDGSQTQLRAQRIRVGTATGSRTTIFRLPINITTVESLQFIADPIGSSRAPVSDEILVSPGDVVTLTIPPQ